MRSLCSYLIIGAAIVTIGSFAGCKKGDQPAGSPQVAFSNDVTFEDIPVPAGFSLVRNDSYSFQNDVTRVGRLIYKGRSDINNVLAFFQQQMPLHGWQEMSYIDYRSSTRYYEKEGQSCILTVEPRTGWSNIRIVLSTQPKTK
ncbi:MAG: hypothetical protein NTX71_02490 [Candidatus Aureabacteria bacterium]|nr:hypothetical protein [Candidatus Auribacterota bacterium]